MTIEERLATLELEQAATKAELAQAKRRFKHFLIKGAIIVACATYFLAAWARPSLVVAQNFILVDEKGKELAGLWFDRGKGGAELSLRDENGKERARLGVGEDGPALVLLDENGKEVWSAPFRAAR